MNAYELGPQTGLSSLTATTRPQPVPGPGEAVLKVRLVALNNRDIQVLEGRYGAKKAEDRIPGSEGVGEVVALGEGVTGLALGDRAVFAHFVNWIDGAFSMAYFGTDYGITHDGWLAEYIKVPAATLVKVPESLGDEQVAGRRRRLLESGAGKPGSCCGGLVSAARLFRPAPGFASSAALDSPG